MSNSAPNLPPEVLLISAVARFIDLHDSQRNFGNQAEFTSEQRPGWKDGRYLSIGVAVVQRLYLQDQTSSYDYLSFGTIFSAVIDGMPNVAEIDVQYVLNVLRRPSELFYLEGEEGSQVKTLKSEKRSTAIIEKTDYADEYRLTSTGRSFIGLSNATKDSLYIRGDAYNLLDAIQNSDFDEMSLFADGIIRDLREAILDVRAALEQHGHSDLVEKYINNFDRYKKVIEGTLEIIGQAEHEIDSPATMDEFIKWADNPENNAMGLSYYNLSNHIDRVRQVLEIFNRVVQELVSVSLTDDRTASPPPSFLQLALHQVKAPLKPEIENFILAQWGALELQTPFYSPLDGLNAVKVKQEITEPATQDFAHEGYELVSHVGNLEFLSKFGNDIVEALILAPLRLSDAIERGWCWLDKKSSPGDLIGVFSAPESLPVDGKIVISVVGDFKEADAFDGVLFFSDLEISVLENVIE